MAKDLKGDEWVCKAKWPLTEIDKSNDDNIDGDHVHSKV